MTINAANGTSYSTFGSDRLGEENVENTCNRLERTRSGRLAKFICKWSLPATAAISLSTRIITCNKNPTDECEEENGQLTGLEYCGFLAAFALTLEKSVRFMMERDCFCCDDSDPQHVNRLQRVKKCYRLTQACMWGSLAASAATSLGTRVIACKDISSGECTDENEYLTPVEITGGLAASALICKKFTEWVFGCSLDEFCANRNEQESDE